MHTKKILIIDDYQFVLDLLDKVFTKEFKCKVYTESDSKKAMDRILDIVPDLVILDIAMPDIAGCEIASEMKEHDELSRTKIIFYSGIMTEEETGSYNKKFKKETCFSKSAKLDDFIKHIRKLFKR